MFTMHPVKTKIFTGLLRQKLKERKNMHYVCITCTRNMTVANYRELEITTEAEKGIQKL